MVAGTLEPELAAIEIAGFSAINVTLRHVNEKNRLTIRELLGKSCGDGAGAHSELLEDTLYRTAFIETATAERSLWFRH